MHLDVNFKRVWIPEAQLLIVIFSVFSQVGGLRAIHENQTLFLWMRKFFKQTIFCQLGPITIFSDLTSEH